MSQNFAKVSSIHIPLNEPFVTLQVLDFNNLCEGGFWGTGLLWYNPVKKAGTLVGLGKRERSGVSCCKSNNCPLCSFSKRLESHMMLWSVACCCSYVQKMNGGEGVKRMECLYFVLSPSANHIAVLGCQGYPCEADMEGRGDLPI